ncbi:MAG TPA: arginase family protein [Thermoanaerobaculia bacterium]|nr:arginase family protein [Thermoanaerobaculia bacterium]
MKLTVLGAPSNLGLKPYDDGRPRQVDQAPRVYRELGLVERLGARDLGDVAAPPYTDFERPPGGTRNEAAIADYSRKLGKRVAAAVTGGDFPLVLGGDCSILLGTLLGLRAPFGLAFIDGHCDFATPAISTTGGAAGMDLALAVGRGGLLARLGLPLVYEIDVVVLGRKDEADEPYYGDHSLGRSAIYDLPYKVIRKRGMARAAAATLRRLDRPELRGFWIHVDADVLDPAVMPAVDSPEPGGLGLEQLAALLTPLVRHPRALGLQVTVYDPGLDPDRVCAARLVDLLERVFTEIR